jgi:hypothetical protein
VKENGASIIVGNIPEFAWMDWKSETAVRVSGLKGET